MPAPARIALCFPSHSHSPLSRLTLLSLPSAPAQTLRLVLDFSAWVLAKNPDEGIMIFTPPAATTSSSSSSYSSSSSSTSTSMGSRFLSADAARAVLQHLREHTDPAVCIRYLQEVVRAGSTVPQFHNELALIYLEDIRALQREHATELAAGAGKQRGTIDGRPASSSLSSAAAAGGKGAGAGGAAGFLAGDPSQYGPGRLGVVRHNLLRFLSESRFYEPERLLPLFPRDSLLEERALLLTRTGRHDEALALFVWELGDLPAAEAYCARVVASHGGGGEGDGAALVRLLEVYLHPERYRRGGGGGAAGGLAGGLAFQTSGGTGVGGATSSSSSSGAATSSLDGGASATPELAAALKLLARCHDKVSPVAVLSMLPDSTPVALIEQFAALVISASCLQLRQTQVNKALLKAQNLRVKLQLVEESRVRVLIDRETVCHSCDKKIGTSAFTVSPQRHVYHYVCHTGLAGGGFVVPDALFQHGQHAQSQFLPQQRQQHRVQPLGGMSSAGALAAAAAVSRQPAYLAGGMSPAINPTFSLP